MRKLCVYADTASFASPACPSIRALAYKNLATAICEAEEPCSVVYESLYELAGALRCPRHVWYRLLAGQACRPTRLQL